MDRRIVLRILDSVGIRTPQRLISNRIDQPDLPPYLVREIRERTGADVSPQSFPFTEVTQIDADTIQLGDKLLRKPFVEKPVSGEDHNIYIYYPTEQGGGVRKLFRKVGNKSSEFCPNVTEIRKEGSFIYEEFMSVDNAEDVKVYTIGEGFAHAETRK
jgi:hypothetical protein